MPSPLRRTLLYLLPLALAVVPRNSVRADEYGELPIAVEIRVIKFAEQELGRVERLLKQQRDLLILADTTTSDDRVVLHPADDLRVRLEAGVLGRVVGLQAKACPWRP